MEFSAAELAALPKAEFAFPGPLRDRLVELVLRGVKTASTDLLAAYEHTGESLPAVGARSVLVDSADRPVGVVEVTGVRVVALGEVGFDHVLAEGEGHGSVAAWRAGHEGFWHGAEMRSFLGDPGFVVSDATPVVLEGFRLVARDREPTKA